MVASIIGSFFVKGGESTESHALSKALHLGTNVAMAITAVATVALAYVMFGGDEFDKPWGLAISVIGGLVVGWALGKAAEYYTSDQYGPVKKIANQAETGPATTILGGISTGMVSVASSIALILAGVGIAYWGGQQTLGADTGGVYGIAVAAIGMLATTGIVVSRRCLRADLRQRRRDRRDGPARPDPFERSPTRSTRSATRPPRSPRGSPSGRPPSPPSPCSRASSTPSATPTRQRRST